VNTELVLFWVMAPISVGSAIAMLLQRSAVYAALLLVVNFFTLAIFFLMLDAPFLFAVQIIVYAGAIMVLFLFVIMLLGVDRSENLHTEPLRGQRPLACIGGAGVVAAVFLLARTAWVSGAHSVAGAANGPGSNIEKLADSLFTRYLLAFEMTSVLLVIAVVGAVVLARHSPSGGVRGSEDVLR
jgi:NADH-quinone oxidoreductase subunit J